MHGDSPCLAADESRTCGVRNLHGKKLQGFSGLVVLGVYYYQENLNMGGRLRGCVAINIMRYDGLHLPSHP